MPLSKGQKKKAKAKRKQVRKDEHMATNMSVLDKAHQLRDHLIDTKYTDGTAESTLKAWEESCSVHMRNATKYDRLQFEMDKHQHLYDSNYKSYMERMTLAPMFKFALLSQDDMPNEEKIHLAKCMDQRVKSDKCYLEHCKIMVKFWKEFLAVSDSECLNEWKMFVNNCEEYHKRMLDNSCELDEAYSEGVRLGVVTEEEYNTQMKAFAHELSHMKHVSMLGEGEACDIDLDYRGR